MGRHSYESLRDYVSVLEDENLVKPIDGADWELEIGALTEAVAFADDPKALLFDDVPGYPSGHRVLTNPYVTERMQALALGLPDGTTGVDLVEAWREQEDEREPQEPNVVTDGPVTENVLTGDDIDLLSFPVPLWHEGDGGRYFGTGDAVITRTTDGSWVNAAPYRCQVHDERTLGVFINQVHHGRMQMREFWANGEDAPVVITGGQSPHVYAAGCIPLPKGQSELAYAGGLKGSPVDVIVESETGLPVPANAEIAVIGHVPPPETETRDEGPFGECTGYYSGIQECPVVYVDEIWHRNDPILQGNPTMYGPTRKFALGGEIVTSAQIWDSIEDDIPNVEGVYALYQQCQAGSDITAISIEQEYAGHAKQATSAVLGSLANVISNSMVIAVDEDIDPANLEEVIFALTSRCDPKQDIDVVGGMPSIELDPRIHPEKKETGELTSSTMLVDACRPYHWKEEYPTVNRVSDELLREVVDAWNVDEWA